jgi:glucose/arabinose dehydrogenase
MLYVSLGEDGTACWAQATTILSGKILRLDVSMLPDGPGGPPDKVLLAPTDNPFAAHPDTNARLVWAMGLRNPFRFQIDPMTGDLFITDVGRDAWEEVDLADQAGLNFGWPWFEGPDTLGTCDSGPTSGFTEPIYAADHNLMVAGISAGLYRQNGGVLQFPLQYEGDYFFADYYTGELYRLNRMGNQWSIAPPVPGQPSAVAWATGLARVADFAIGPDGALWYCLQAPANRVHRIAYVGPAGVEPAPLPSADQDPVHYDLQGRRVDNPKRTGLYFTRRGAKKVVLK